MTGRAPVKAPNVGLAWLRCTEACLDKPRTDPNCTHGPDGFTVRCLEYTETQREQVQAISRVALRVVQRIRTEAEGMDFGSEDQLRRRSALLECQAQLCAWIRSNEAA